MEYIILAVIVAAILATCGFLLYSVKQGFRADLATVVLDGERRYQRARGVAQELHRLLGDEDRHIRRMVILLSKGDQDLLAGYVESIPKPQYSELRKPVSEANMLMAHQERVKTLVEASTDILGPEE